MKKVIIVGFHGPAFSGKDTACKLLAEMADRTQVAVINTRYAEPIYSMVRTLVPEACSDLPKEAKERPRPALGGLSVRQMTVAIGQGARQFNSTCWVEIWQNQVLKAVQDALLVGAERVLVLVPDMRFKNERKAFDEIAISLLEKLEEFQYPYAVSAASLLLHVQPVNGPVNAQFDKATETLMGVRQRDRVVINDHNLGLAGLAGSLQAALMSDPESPATYVFHQVMGVGDDGEPWASAARRLDEDNG